MEEGNMKLIFKYRYEENKYIRICESFKMPYNDIVKKMDYKEYTDYILRNNILNETYLASYIDSSDLSLTEYILKNLNDKDVSYCDIGSQRWGAYIEDKKVDIALIFSEEDDERAYIDREEVAYAMSKWRDFLKREIIDGSYEEIIDTENVYKKEKVEK